MKKIVAVSALIALVSAFTGCSGAVADEHTTGTSETTASITSTSTTSTTGTTVTTETEEQTTTQTTTQTKRTTTATTTKATTAKATTTKAKTTKATTTKKITTKAQKTTRTATDDEMELLYGTAYIQVMQDYNEGQKKLREQKLYISEIETEIEELTEQASALYVGYRQDVDKLKERYAAMGLLNSGAYTSAVKNLEQNYKANLAPISEKIDKLEEALEEAEEEYALLEEEYPTLSEWELEELIEEAYWDAVEEFQQNTLS